MVIKYDNKNDYKIFIILYLKLYFYIFFFIIIIIIINIKFIYTSIINIINIISNCMQNKNFLARYK